MFRGSGVAYQSVGLGATTDALWLPASSGGDGQLPDQRLQQCRLSHPVVPEDADDLMLAYGKADPVEPEEAVDNRRQLIARRLAIIMHEMLRHGTEFKAA